MRTYDFSRGYEQLLKPDIVALLTSIHEYKGEQALFIEAKADVLTKLVDIAKVQSTETVTVIVSGSGSGSGSGAEGAGSACAEEAPPDWDCAPLEGSLPGWETAGASGVLEAGGTEAFSAFSPALSPALFP